MARTEGPSPWRANMIAPVSLRVTVPNPHLWNGRKDPYLYKAVLELRSQAQWWIQSNSRSGLRFY